MQRARTFVMTAMLAACHPAPSIVYAPGVPIEPASQGSGATTTETKTDAKTETKTDVTPARTVSTTPAPGRRDIELTTVPMALVLVKGALVWTDRAGAVWMMPADFSEPPRRISEQHRDGFATHPFAAGDQVLVKADKAFLSIALPGGAITHVSVTGAPGVIEAAIANATTIFLTVFKHDQVLQVPIGGGALHHVADVQNAVLALHRDTLYIASYATGDLVAVPVAGGTPRTLARKLHRPTAIIADDTAAYVYTEDDRRVVRVPLDGSASAILGEQLDNSDELVLAGDSVYTVSWPRKLVRLPNTGGRVTTLADDLFQPRGVVHDDHYVYVTSDSPPRIVRVPL